MTDHLDMYILDQSANLMIQGMTETILLTTSINVTTFLQSVILG